MKNYYCIEVDKAASVKDHADFIFRCKDLKHAKKRALSNQFFKGSILKIYSDRNLLFLLAIYKKRWENKES